MNRKYLWIVVVVLALVTGGIFAMKGHDSSYRQTAPEGNEPARGDAPGERFLASAPVVWRVDKPLRFSVPGGVASAPRVSPDGAKVVFVRTTGAGSELVVAELPSGRLSPLAIPLDEVADPAWNADGSKIVFAGSRKGISEIYLHDLKTGKLTRVTNDPKRRKSWPRCSPHPFDNNYRIAYVSEARGRKDIWWVRESGRLDQPVTVAPADVETFRASPAWKELGDGEAPAPLTRGGDLPEWSPSGNLLLYRTSRGYAILAYNHQTWWQEAAIPLPVTDGVLSWAPNQTVFLEYSPDRSAASVIPRDGFKRKPVLPGAPLFSSPAYFPDGRGFAFIITANGRSTLAVEPYDDPLGDVANLWMYPYTPDQKRKLTGNQMLLLTTGHDRIYTLYDSERYSCGADAEIGFHARPYLVTSDAALETFYAAFAALYATVEREELAGALEEFARQGAAVAREKRVSPDVERFFHTGLLLLKPESAARVSAEARREAARVVAASGVQTSLFGEKLDYGDFFIRGKYERDKDLQGYFRAIKWFQAFTFDLAKEEERRAAAEILAVASSPNVRPQLERIYALYRDMVGESRYLNPTNISEIAPTGPLSPAKAGLPWITTLESFRLMPSIYTLDAYIFDRLITHTNSADMVGSMPEMRLLPKGLDIMAAFGSDEARQILINELKEGRFAGYERTLARVADEIRSYPRSDWDANLYQNWLDALAALVREPPASAPAFTRTKGWKRKQLNTALGSWVNLRYETIAVVEQVSAECGEGGYEQLDVGKPRGYVEPTPEFFLRLDQGFGKLAAQMERAVRDPALRKGVLTKIAGYRSHLRSLATIARKELDGKPLTDAEYAEILNIGGTIEHFIVQMGSLNAARDDNAIRNPEPIRKIVDIQKNPMTGERLYEALGHVSEINVAVPFYGRRQIVKGPVYSYHEFTSSEALDSAKWRASGRQPPPVWLRPYYAGKGTAPLGTLTDLNGKP